MIWKKDLLAKEMQFVDGVNDNVFIKKQSDKVFKNKKELKP